MVAAGSGYGNEAAAHFWQGHPYYIPYGRDCTILLNLQGI
jgi:hypothetical protein